MENLVQHNKELKRMQNNVNLMVDLMLEDYLDIKKSLDKGEELSEEVKFLYKRLEYYLKVL